MSIDSSASFRDRLSATRRTGEVVIRGRHAVDPSLNLIARRLQGIAWQTELTVDEHQASLEAQKHPESPKFLVAPMPDFRTWAVRMYIGGAQRTLGFVKPDNGDISVALRFADMARTYFWKYRQRNAHKPSDIELNFSAERADADLVNETDVVNLLRDIEAHLLKIGAITTAEDFEKQRQDARKRKSAQRTLSGAFLEMSDVWQRRLVKNESAHNTKLDMLCKQIQFLTDEVRFLRGCLSSQPAQRSVPVCLPPSPLRSNRPLIAVEPSDSSGV